MQPRTRRRRFDDKAIKGLKPKAKRYAVPDSEMIGHYVRVMPSGVKSYCAVARDPYGKQIWTKINNTDHVGIDEARAKAREIISRVKAGRSATEPPPPAPDSFATVAAAWVKRHVEAKGLRTRAEIERVLRVYVFPHWGDRPFVEVRRSDVARLLDHIEDHNGPRQADTTLAIIRSICTWYAQRDDSYTIPIVRGMKRSTNHPRDRILDDREIGCVWEVCEESGAFGALLQLALTTAQRKAKLLLMSRAAISADGVWTVPTEPREKGTGGQLVLPKLALGVLRRLPRIHGSDLLFPRMSAAHAMVKIRAALPKDFPQFTIHDLRRTWRSLASKAGVNPEHAEHVMGHVIGGVEGTYDRYPYAPEKKIALEKVAALIEQIISESPDKVVPFKAARS
jgi:integrase